MEETVLQIANANLVLHCMLWHFGSIPSIVLLGGILKLHTCIYAWPKKPDAYNISMWHPCEL